MQGRTSEQELRRRAIARALANGGARTVVRVRYGFYRVRSATQPGVEYRVSQDASGRYRCACPAGVAGRPCWHVASVYIAKVERGGGRVTGPALVQRATPSPSPALPANVVPLRRAA